MSHTFRPVYRVWIVALFISGCASIQMQDLEELLNSNLPLTEETVADGLREALDVGTSRTSSVLSREGGFSDNLLLRIALPEEFNAVASRLRSLGLDEQVDDFELKMNRAAERAAVEAVDVFATAIRSMSIQDAFAILDGPQNAATEYFKLKTSAELTGRFSPHVRSAMEEVGVYVVYSSLVERYNSIPLVRPINVDLEVHIVERTLFGIFDTLAGEELRIREDPLARTTNLLKRVFGSRD